MQQVTYFSYLDYSSSISVYIEIKLFFSRRLPPTQTTCTHTNSVVIALPKGRGKRREISLTLCFKVLFASFNACSCQMEDRRHIMMILSS